MAFIIEAYPGRGACDTIYCKARCTSFYRMGILSHQVLIRLPPSTQHEVVSYPHHRRVPSKSQGHILDNSPRYAPTTCCDPNQFARVTFQTTTPYTRPATGTPRLRLQGQISTGSTLLVRQQSVSPSTNHARSRCADQSTCQLQCRVCRAWCALAC